jgi:hypothetical protein
MVEIVSVEQVLRPGCEVFNFGVDEDHSYVAGGVVVHNCDVLAESDFYGYGPGMYPPDKWPLAPHPFCACSQAGPVLFRPPSEWGTPKPPSRALQADPGDTRFYAAHSERWTERNMERQQAVVRGVIAEVEQLRRAA